MFAHMHYMEDNVKAIVPVTLMRNLNPESICDYNNAQLYVVYWRSSQGGGEGHYKALILQLVGKAFSD